MSSGRIEPPVQFDDFHHVLLWGVTVGGQEAVQAVVHADKGRPHARLPSVAGYIVPSVATIATLIVAGRQRPPKLAATLANIGRSGNEGEAAKELARAQRTTRNTLSYALRGGGSVRSLRPDRLQALAVGAALPPEICACISEAHDDAVASDWVKPLDTALLRVAIAATVADLDDKISVDAVLASEADLTDGRLSRLRSGLDIVQALFEEKRLTEEDRRRWVDRLFDESLGKEFGDER